MSSNLLLTEFISKLIRISWYHLFFPTFQLDNIKLLPKISKLCFFLKVDKITCACQRNANIAQLCWRSGQPWQRDRANWSRKNSFFHEISWCHLLLPTERKYFSTLDFQKPLENGLTKLKEEKYLFLFCSKWFLFLQNILWSFKVHVYCIHVTFSFQLASWPWLLHLESTSEVQRWI